MIKAKSMYLLAMMQDQKVYKLYNPVNGKMIISRDVEFDEEGLWNWSNSHEDYNVFPFVDEEDNEEKFEQQLATPPISPLLTNVRVATPLS